MHPGCIGEVCTAGDLYVHGELFSKEIIVISKIRRPSQLLLDEIFSRRALMLCSGAGSGNWAARVNHRGDMMPVVQAQKSLQLGQCCGPNGLAQDLLASKLYETRTHHIKPQKWALFTP